MDGEVRRMYFIPSYDMAQSLQRVYLGKTIERHDVIMFLHEALEYDYMNYYGIADYNEAHVLANKRYNYGKELVQFLKKRNG